MATREQLVALEAQTHQLMAANKFMEEENNALIQRKNKIKAEVDAIIVDAQSKADNILNNAKDSKAASDLKIAKLRSTVEVELQTAKQVRTEAERIKRDAENERDDFRAYKFAEETNILARNRDAAAKAGQAIALIKEANAKEIALTTREGNATRAEELAKEKLAELSVVIDLNNQLIARIDTAKKENQTVLCAIDKTKRDNDTVLLEIKKQNDKIDRDIAINKHLIDQAQTAKQELETKKKELTVLINTQARERQGLEEARISLEEKEALNAKLVKQIDDKINTLKKLRGKE